MKSSALVSSSEFTWWPELGMGHHSAAPISYDGGYWHEYRERDATPMGQALTEARIDFVRRHFKGRVIDIGIGGGRFVSDGDHYGYDISRPAIDWLGPRYRNPYAGAEAIACWDSLEHLPEPDMLVRAIQGWVFVSMPIYEGPDHCLASKHYKPGEHLWYWTDPGLIRWFNRLGFRLVERSDIESRLGREGILSYAFRRAV